MKTIYILTTLAAASLLTACGGGDSATNLGTVDDSPARWLADPEPASAHLFFHSR